MKTMTVRLPEALAADITAESRRRGLSQSDVVRDRLTRGSKHAKPATLEAIADLIGSVGHLAGDVSARRKDYLRSTGYGRRRPR